jgi:RimJ/RimL family protein N-acetyltransferase
VFWVELDATLDRLDSALEADATGEPLPAVSEVFRILAADFGPASVPFVLTQHELIGSVAELQASAVARLIRGAMAVRGFLVRAGMPAPRAQATAYALLGAATAGAQAWAEAGSSRGALGPYLESALAVVHGTDAADAAAPHGDLTAFEYASPIETDRLRLRLLTTDDIDAVHSYQSLDDVCRYQLFEPRTRVEVEQFVTRVSAHRRLERDGDFLQLAIEHRADGTVVGDLYFAIKSRAQRTAEIGWTLHPDHHGRGIATEAATAVLDLAFTSLGLHRVIAELDPRNAASVALCHRLGMREEAHFIEDMYFKGEWADTGVFAILAAEYRTH